MSAPLPLGERAPIQVTIAELAGRTFTVRRINGRSLAALRAFQSDPENFELAWSAARACVPDLTAEDALDLSLDAVLKIIWLASADIDLVHAALAKGEGEATPPALSSGTTSATPSPASPLGIT